LPGYASFANLYGDVVKCLVSLTFRISYSSLKQVNVSATYTFDPNFPTLTCIAPIFTDPNLVQVVSLNAYAV
jgi:hypothetical protein